MDDRAKIREVAKRVAEIANSPHTEIKRQKWTKLNSLKSAEPLIYIRAFAFHEIFDSKLLSCEDPFLRAYERVLYEAIYRDQLKDDYIVEPYVTVGCVYENNPSLRWGVPCELGEKPGLGGAAGFKPSIVEEEDFEKLVMPSHKINEEATKQRFDRLNDAIGDILTVDLNRGPMLFMWSGDISTDLAKLRGLEQIMWDAYDRPEFLHKLSSFLQKGVLRVHEQAEAAGDWSLANNQNQCMPYAEETLAPKANAFGAKRSDIWGYAAAQEFTTFSGEMFNEFMFQYQKPILEKFALSAYGCCEDLTGKIKYLKTLKNLRRIAISPFANVEKCAEQIGSDYVASYRPDPSAMVSRGLNEEYARAELRRCFDVLKQNNCYFDITLKDVETVGKDPTAVPRFVQVCREEIAKAF